MADIPGGVLGGPMRLIIATTRDEPIDMIADGRADFAYLGPTLNVRTRAKVEILAGEAENGQAGMTFRALSEYFPARHTRALNPGERGINPATMAWQVRYDRPGNAREIGIDPSTLWRKLKDEGDG